MKLQPCHSPFFVARDAILQVDQVPMGDQNFCDIRERFAESWLGVEARVKGRTP
jgi:hypothetical protein